MMDNSPAPSTTETAIRDLVPRNGPGAAEIGFSPPDRYNASTILFDNLDKGHGDKIAILSDAGTLSYKELCDRASQYGHGVKALGLSRNDRVLMVLDDGPDYAAAIFGTIRAGFVPVLINTQSPPDLFAYFIENSGAKACITQQNHFENLRKETASNEIFPITILTDVTATDDSNAPQLYGTDWIDAQPTDLACADTGRDEMAFWMYSSGSTGRPKAVVHLQHDMLYTALSYAKTILNLTSSDICFSVPKIFFAYGFGNSLTFPFHIGAASVLFSGRPTPDRIFEQIERYKPTHLFALPTVYTALIKSDAAENADLSSVKRCISAAEILSQDVFNAWQNRFGHRVVEGLGSTEVLHIYLSNTGDWQKPGSAGQRVAGYEIKLTDHDGNSVPVNKEGILWVRGDSNAPCYWQKPDKTAETMRQGWIWTGDKFTQDEDGFFFFKGRADDLIKVSGQWIYPLEVELCLNEHPIVQESAVLGVPLDDGRTTLLAVVSTTETEPAPPDITRTLQNYVKDTLMPYKYPRHLILLDRLPKTGTGKIDRQELLKQWIDQMTAEQRIEQ